MDQHLAYLIGGMAGGLLFLYFHIPGGCLVGAMLGSMIVKLCGAEGELPGTVYIAAQIVIGISIGSMFSWETFSQLKAEIPVMLISTGILVLAAVVSAVLVHRITGIDAIGAVLSTTPGGLNAVMGMADMNADLPRIMAFQMTRLYAIILLTPACCWILRLFMRS